MIQKIEISIVIALIILVNGPAKAIAFTVASHPENRESQDVGCGELMLTASSTPGGDAITELEVHESGTTATVPFFLRNQNNKCEALDDVTLGANLIGERGAVEAGVVFSFKSRGQDVGTSGVMVPKDGREVLIEMSITGLTHSGVYTIRLFAEHDGRSAPLPDVSLTRLEAPDLYIVGQDQNNAITLDRTVTSFDHSFRIASKNQTKVDDLRIFVDDFVGPEKNPIIPIQNPSKDNGSITLGGNDEIILNVTADLPLEGEYTSIITLFYAGNREDVKLVVNRSWPATTVAVEDLGTVQGKIWPLFGDQKPNAQITINLTSTSPLSTTIESVELLGLFLMDGTNVKDNVRSLVNFDPAQQFSPVGVVNSNDPLDPIYSISGLNTAGTYEGKLIVGIVDAKPLEEVPFKLQLKAPWQLAILLIGSSIIVSSLLRKYLGTNLPRLRDERLANEYLIRLQNSREEYQGMVKSRKIDADSARCMADLFESIQNDLVEVMTKYSNEGAKSSLETAGKKLGLISAIGRTLYVINDPKNQEKDLQNNEWQNLVNNLIIAKPFSQDDSTQLIKKMKELAIKAQTGMRKLADVEGIDYDNLDDLKENAIRIDKEIKRIERFAFVVALAIATVSGLVLLWSPNPTWGSNEDLLAAFLWGFGLFKVSNAVAIPVLETFTGLPDLINKIGNPSSEGGSSG